MALDIINLVGKKVIVTGHTGFKGSWLTLLLNKIGANVNGISLVNDNENTIYLKANVSNLLQREFFIDIRDSLSLKEAIVDINPDYIFHLAAQSLVIKSYKNPVETFSTNIVGTMNLLDTSLSLSSLKGIAIATTDKVYKNKNSNKPFTEDEELGGSDPYSASKAAVELLVSSMAVNMNHNNIPITTVRAGNVVGGGDWAEDRLVPDIVRALETNSELLIRNPLATRPFQHVLDCVYGYILIAERHLSLKSKKIFETYNLGPLESLSVSEIIKIFEKTYSKKLRVTQPNSIYLESSSLTLNTEKARSELKWKPFFSPINTIENTADWYLNKRFGQNLEKIIETDIQDYLRKINEV
jgi:CDP-glucose 4,6-dehydratase